ncbi:hypothetical protein SEUCBS140593_003790 [Sporothrix eucalyptigena]|uniref:CID domain-containing protein n=1 Tax=Sporothrix eucalyptigena TaxID=1812306 RepID=A0ABP0BHT5_9PEZI
MADAAAAAQLAIAKASLTAVLLRPDPAPCARADIDEFAGLLALTAVRCSNANVQTCKKWMLRHVTESPARAAAIGRYLVALANSFSPFVASTEGTKQTSTRRKRLHLLYIVNDVLHQVTFRGGCRGAGDSTSGSTFEASIEPSLEPLVASAASFVRAPKQLAKIRNLLDLWTEKRYVTDAAVLAKLYSAVEEGPRLAEEKLQKDIKQELKKSGVTPATTNKEAPFLLPAQHGDPSTPWYDLPAANWLAVLEPNSTRPMNPAALKPLQMTPGPAAPALVTSVQALLEDVNRIFDEGGAAKKTSTTDMETDINALGEHIEIDVFSGEFIDSDTYYGWSRAFCKSMKDRHRSKNGSGTNLVLPDADRDRGRSRDSKSQSLREDSRSSSQSSKPAFKKRQIFITVPATSVPSKQSLPSPFAVKESVQV